MTNSDNSDNLAKVEISKTQKSFLDFCKEYKWGKLEVTVKNGEPVFSKELVKEHKHD